MKLIITTLNSKYVHTNLAIRYLQANAIPEGVQSRLAEFTINDHLENILGELFNYKANIYAFSCYIWNIEKTLKIADSLKQVRPDCTIILGGPEVSYDSKEILNKSSCDIIVKGEGEKTFRELLKKLKENTSLENLEGIAYKDGGKLIEKQDISKSMSLEVLDFPYLNEDMSKFNNQIIYYEGSRGCPFNCSYCLSSVDRGLRYRPLETIKKELGFFLKHRVKQVKFVDRTFNAHKSWAREVIKYLIENNNNHTNFHFEVAGDILDDELIHLFNQAPVGLFQLEIGVQSINTETLSSVKRKTNIDKIEDNIKKLQQSKNIHIHLDLIAGLPFEDVKSFEISFNRVYNMHPHMLQLGFLKLLKGSPIALEKDKYHYRHTSYAPYEILSNDSINYEEILFLKKIEFLVDKYNNSNTFNSSLSYFIGVFKEPFNFFKSLSMYWQEHNLFDLSLKKDKYYEVLLDFAKETDINLSLVSNLIKYDYLKSMKLTLPSFLENNSPDKDKIFELLKNQSFVSKYLPGKEHIAAKNLFKQVSVEIFDYDIIGNLDNKRTALIFIKDSGKDIGIKNDYAHIKEI